VIRQHVRERRMQRGHRGLHAMRDATLSAVTPPLHLIKYFALIYFTVIYIIYRNILCTDTL